MATITPTVEGIKNGFIITWSTLTGTNTTGVAVELSRFPDKVVQVTGTFDTTTVILEGSNDSGDSPTYYQLTDPGNTAISFTAAGGETVLDNPYLIRPRVTAGGASTDVDVKLMCMGRK